MPTCPQDRPLRARTAHQPVPASGARATVGERTSVTRGATTTGTTGDRTETNPTAGGRTMADRGTATVSGRLTGSDSIETTATVSGRETSSTIAAMTGIGGAHAHRGENGAEARICGGTGGDRDRAR